ncbi:MAG: hypothetical protein OXI71_14130 [Gemmatimonadota bacterium]|nr:hypothetical protein [Gemmatimonadota bacterium]
MKRETAEAVAEAIRAAQGDVATKEDLANLEIRMGTRFQAMLWRALLLHAFAVVGAIMALEKLFS